ncbi:hypothetical protein M2475_001823 [Breznakia sp. PF5-3]|uniref:DUF4279 domain-containing protein n=1 Tax=unclassified Breznakia TaxID=2623764 RepID=UPI002406324E|nr:MULTISPECIES: DUF4279 domain-containing protein [unclassified Breznakia]MDF9825368.1 hypothetical protein [Breznakia sp. PM6-1]MDF9836246.1 hypothetical protein [Breznakia sp. PF5-3]MDF9838514.1 hypothetical protein [Breznakia sp. PFB2-8]MDF9860491.1 hypothetical protein [Breznakia sp. PH5-24]
MEYLKKTNARIKFEIRGDKFDPQLISDKLNLVPDKIWKTGDFIENRNAKRKCSAWILGGEFIETLDIGEEITKIINKIESKTVIINELKKELNVECNFIIAVETWDEQNPSIYLSKRVISFANEVQADFDFDMYVYNS